MKHAYLILAHGSFDLLRLLISRLDDERNDIFVHLDKKVKVLPELHAEHAGLYFTEERVDVCWGDWTVVEAEYVLFAAAVARGPYQYYHLLSGVDLPVKSQDYIHDFCDTHQGTEFIGYTLKTCTPGRVYSRTGDFGNLPEPGRRLQKRLPVGERDGCYGPPFPGSSSLGTKGLQPQFLRRRNGDANLGLAGAFPGKTLQHAG